MKKATSTDVDPRFEPVVQAFAGNPQVARERAFSSENVLTVQGKIFAMLVRGKLCAKLPKARVDALVDRGVGERFDPRGNGHLMKEWVVVAGKKASWVDLAKEAYEYVRGAKR